MKAVFCGLMLVLVCTAEIGCDGLGQDVKITRLPEREIVWKSAGGGFLTWGCGGKYLYGVSGPPKAKVFDIWMWSGDTVLRRPQVNAGDTNRLAMLSEDLFVEFGTSENGDHEILIKHADDSKILRKWSLGWQWYCKGIRSSRNGDVVAVAMAPGFLDPHRQDRRFGLIEKDSEQIRWFSIPPPKKAATDTIMAIVPSDDGAYAAVAGWDYGAIVIDAKTDKVLWYVHPQGEANLEDIAISPDNKLVYAGGVMGFVYVIEMATGEVVATWVASETGKGDNGHRISTIAISPDGRFVAAGTGPVGLCWVWWRDTGKIAAILDHGHNTIRSVLFSPDSSSLATVAGGAIKIWRMPQ